jgi:hypothetical protein
MKYDMIPDSESQSLVIDMKEPLSSCTASGGHWRASDDPDRQSSGVFPVDESLHIAPVQVLFSAFEGVA